MTDQPWAVAVRTAARAHGGEGARGAAGAARLGLRAQVGRVPHARLERPRRAAGQPERQATAAVLPGARTPALLDLPAGTVVDGEVVVVRDGGLDFDVLQNRIHPAESRVRMLAEETPALLVAFDLLAVQGTDVRGYAFGDRRRLLVGSGRGFASPWHLTPSTEDRETWAGAGSTSSNPPAVTASWPSALDRPYVEGERAMIKVKHRRSVDAVVGGFRLHKDGGKVGSMLLGLYNAGGRAALHRPPLRVQRREATAPASAPTALGGADRIWRTRPAPGGAEPLDRRQGPVLGAGATRTGRCR